ncbi:NUDIX hydrolase [Candidatus Berkelbacteria bacterium]|nr:NUDIX hydrolase [Candidatus Berkelbacteria bacterium]
MIQLAGCIVQNDQGEILLLHRNTPERVQWELPGGKIEPDEAPEDAVRREVFEELGITLTNLAPFGEDSFVEDNQEFHYHWFTAVIADGLPQPLEDKFDEVRYIPLAELASLPLSANMRQLLPHILAVHLVSQPR